MGMGAMTSKREALQRVGLFSGLPQASFDRIVSMSFVQRFGEDSILFAEGDRPDFVYAVAAGQVSLVTAARSGNWVMEFFGPGATLLLPAAILDLPFLLTARAMSEGLVMLIPAYDFRHEMEKDVHIAAATAAEVARQWRLMLSQLKELKAQNAEERLAGYILSRCPAHNGSMSLPMPGYKRDLASRLGMTPETFSRTMKRLSAAGVRSDGDAIVIEDVARLASLLNLAR